MTNPREGFRAGFRRDLERFSAAKADFNAEFRKAILEPLGRWLSRHFGKVKP